MLTLHVPLPVHAPDQPPKVDPDAGAALSVTVVPMEKLAAHVEPQLMPAGVDVIVPLPLPLFATPRMKLTGAAVAVKVAETSRAALIVTAQPPVPAHAPPQPAKVEPAAGEAESVTTVSGA